MKPEMGEVCRFDKGEPPSIFHFSSTRQEIAIEIAMALTFPAVSVSFHLLHSLPNSTYPPSLSPIYRCPFLLLSHTAGGRLLSDPTTSSSPLFQDSFNSKKASWLEVRAFLPNLTQEPILKEALKEPVAFVGGMFAGLLRLDLNEEPLKEWVSRTVEASGMTAEEIRKKDGGEEDEEERPQEIEIE
ncbi:UNVERIFIED_CONTAM: hypothetical protein Sradi_4091700 [Sesamum radiatum]|uniref:Uncharacterized protein n=1 Tax=Sesamum radiatum TaxID=300843 RepID=A0AAW2PN56_SESRA